VFLDPGLDITASLTDVYLTTLAGHTVHARSFESQVVLHWSKETGDLLWGKAISFTRSLPCMSLPLLLARLWYAPSLLLAPLPSPDPHLIPHLSGQGSALIDWFLFLKLIPCVQLTHRPDDGGSKYL
jgi:hypothetical protein